MTAPDVSVVIPTRNRRTLLMQTLATVRAQRGLRVEVVVVDDGSDDGTQEALRAHAGPLFHVVRHARAEGQSRARNDGIRQATGRKVAMLDDDDVWHVDKLVSQVSAMESTGAGWAYSSALHVLPDLTLWRRDPAPGPDELARRLPGENVVPAGASNVIANREVLGAIGGFDEELEHMSDWDMWLKLLRTGPPAVVDRYHVVYRLHPGNLALKQEAGILHEAAIIDVRYRDLRAGPLNLIPIHRWLATSNWRNGNRAAARAHWVRAFRAGDRTALLRLGRSIIPVTRLRGGAGADGWPDGALDWVRGAMRAD